MAGFRFRVEAVYDVDGFEGILLGGPVLERGGDLAVGDSVMVPTVAGRMSVRCTGFPLIRWGQDKRHWASITVAGIAIADVVTGEIAGTD